MLPFRSADEPVVDPAEFATAAQDLVPLLAHVRVTVVAHVVSRRAAGVSVERVVVEVDTLVRDAAAGLPLRSEGEQKALELLLAAVVRWGVAAYGDAERAHWHVALDHGPFADGRGSPHG